MTLPNNRNRKLSIFQHGYQLCVVMYRAGPRDRVALDKLFKQLQQQLSRYKQTVADHDKRRAAYPLDTGEVQ